MLSIMALSGTSSFSLTFFHLKGAQLADTGIGNRIQGPHTTDSRGWRRHGRMPRCIVMLPWCSQSHRKGRAPGGGP